MRRQILTCVLLLIASFAATAKSAGFDPAQVPETVGWVVHVDVEKASAGPLWASIEPVLKANPKFAAGLKQVEAVTQLQLPRDVQDLTIFGTDYDDVSFAIIARSKADPKRLT